MAKLIETAAAHDRQVLPLSIPGKDVFDLLAEDILRERFQAFPGHAKAQLDWELWHEQSPEGTDRKAFYRQTYGIVETPMLFGEVATAMRDRGVIPPEIENLLIELERLAWPSIT